MALPPLADVTALTARLPGVSVDAAWAEAVLGDVSAHARAEAAQTWVDEAGDLTEVPDIVTTVVLSAARRAYLNPDLLVSEQAGERSVRIADVAAGVVFTPPELAALHRLRATSGLWSLQVTGADDLRDRMHVTEGDGDPILMYAATEAPE